MLQTPAEICDLKTNPWICRHTTNNGSAKKMHSVGMKTVRNDRRKTPPLSLSYFFHRKRYDIIENENDISNAVILETKIYGRGHIENDRNPSKQHFKK